MMCGGITAFNGLRHSKAGPGDLVAVHGVGGVGHLAVQFGDKMGFRVVAIARGRAREELARRLGASEYIDSTAGDASESLRAMGGAAVIFDTVSHGSLQSGLISGLRPNGQLIVAEGLDPITVKGHDLAFPRLNISGWYSGVAADSEDTLNFAVLKGVHPIVETHPLPDAETAFLNRNKANIRPVLIP
jgi:D-arabinose 1-dehydrogenase-like Zn-dependent alcohol dehydrogenase